MFVVLTYPVNSFIVCVTLEYKASLRLWLRNVPVHYFWFAPYFYATPQPRTHGVAAPTRNDVEFTIITSAGEELMQVSGKIAEVGEWLAIY